MDARSEDRTPYRATKRIEAPDDASMADQRECIARALMILRRRVERGTILGDSGDTRKWLTLELAGAEREVFGIITLDAHHRMIGKHDLFFGSVDRARVYPREVLKGVPSRQRGGMHRLPQSPFRHRQAKRERSRNHV